jgi:hypothetical protein
MPWPEEACWDQVVRLIVQAAVEERSGKFVPPTMARGSYCELLNPCQPSRVFYLCSHPLTVKRLSANFPDGHSTGVISWESPLANRTSWFCSGTMVR